MALTDEEITSAQLALDLQFDLACVELRGFFDRRESIRLLTRLRKLGDFAVPAMLVMSNGMNPEERASLLDCLKFYLVTYPPPARAAKTFGDLATDGFRRRKLKAG